MIKNNVESYLKEIFILIDTKYFYFGEKDADTKNKIRDIIQEVIECIYRNEESDDTRENRECIFFIIRKIKLINFLITTAYKEKTSIAMYKRVIANINEIINIEKTSLKNIKSLYTD